jgi:hypothetical protein
MNSNLDLAKIAFRALHDKKFQDEHGDQAYMELENSYMYVCKQLSPSERTEFHSWKELEKKIMKNDFPEFA